jgi:hypothetical protein
VIRRRRRDGETARRVGSCESSVVRRPA